MLPISGRGPVWAGHQSTCQDIWCNLPTLSPTRYACPPRTLIYLSAEGSGQLANGTPGRNTPRLRTDSICPEAPNGMKFNRTQIIAMNGPGKTFRSTTRGTKRRRENHGIVIKHAHRLLACEAIMPRLKPGCVFHDGQNRSWDTDLPIRYHVCGSATRNRLTHLQYFNDVVRMPDKGRSKGWLNKECPIDDGSDTATASGQPQPPSREYSCPSPDLADLASHARDSSAPSQVSDRHCHQVLRQATRCEAW